MPKPINPERQKEAIDFITSTTGESIGDFHESLKSGVILCNLLNKLQPGTVAKVNKSNMPFMQMENIAAYVEGSRKLGVPDEYNFVTVDLYEAKDLAQVVENVLNLKRIRGFGFEKAKVGGNVGIINPHSTTDQTTSAKSTSAFVSTNQTAVNNENDVKRTGTAFTSGRKENEVAMVCGVCTKYITAGAVSALGRTWHPNCFTCKKCGVKLATTKYYDHNDQPYCERCILIVNPNNVRAATKNHALFGAKN